MAFNISGVTDFLTSRIFQAPGDMPELSEEQEDCKLVFSNSPFPDYEEYKRMAGIDSEHVNAIKKKKKKKSALLENASQGLLKSITNIARVDSKRKKKWKIEYFIIDIESLVHPKTKILKSLFCYPSNHQIFGSEVVTHILQAKWENYGRNQILFKGIVYSLFVALISVNSLRIMPIRLIDSKNGLLIKNILI